MFYTLITEVGNFVRNPDRRCNEDPNKSSKKLAVCSELAEAVFSSQKSTKVILENKSTVVVFIVATKY